MEPVMDNLHFIKTGNLWIPWKSFSIYIHKF
jgi:hypothetical protein